MWIEDLTKALWILNGDPLKWTCCIEKISDGIITMTSGQKFSVAALVEKYNSEYETRSDNV